MFQNLLDFACVATFLCKATIDSKQNDVEWNADQSDTHFQNACHTVLCHFSCHYPVTDRHLYTVPSSHNYSDISCGSPPIFRISLWSQLNGGNNFAVFYRKIVVINLVLLQTYVRLMRYFWRSHDKFKNQLTLLQYLKPASHNRKPASMWAKFSQSNKDVQEFSKLFFAVVFVLAAGVKSITHRKKGIINVGTCIFCFMKSPITSDQISLMPANLLITHCLWSEI